MFEPHAESPRAIVVVATAHDHTVERDVSAAACHRGVKPIQISGGDISGEVSDDISAYLDRDRVWITRVFGLGHKNGDDPVSNSIPF
jgi:hypothetical protein